LAFKLETIITFNKNKEYTMKTLKIITLNAALIMTPMSSIAQLSDANGLIGFVADLPVIGGLLGTASELPIINGFLSHESGLGGLESLPLINLSPLLSLENGIPIVERLPVITRIPVLGAIIGDGKGPDPISLIGEVLGLEVLPLTFLFDGSVPL
jgi:hypothetical protein